MAVSQTLALVGSTTSSEQKGPEVLSVVSLHFGFPPSVKKHACLDQLEALITPQSVVRVNGVSIYVRLGIGRLQQTPQHYEGTKLVR